MCEAGLTIVSGLALGIDGAAHEGALASQAPASTLAVLGTGLDRIYPSSHANLACSMAEKGVLISEFSLGTPAQQHNFPRRNRLIAGLSLGVLVVEAAAASGSLITARLAGENGREVFAIPGSIHAPLSKGCHALIKEGAKLVESAHDILSELPNFLLPASIPTQTITPTQTTTQSETTSIHQSILEALGHDPINLDQLAERTQMQVESLNIALLELELTGIIAKLPGQNFNVYKQHTCPDTHSVPIMCPYSILFHNLTLFITSIRPNGKTAHHCRNLAWHKTSLAHLAALPKKKTTLSLSTMCFRPLLDIY